MKRLAAKFFAAPLLAAMAGIPQVTSAAAASAATSWPMLGRNPHHTADSAGNPNSLTAPTLGLNWMSNLHAADLGSPVVAFNTVLSKTVVYVSDENGDVFAFDEANGQQLWGVNLGLGDPSRPTPAVAPDGSVWVASSYGATVTKLDGATGKTLCSKKLIGGIDASLMIATPPGGVPTVYTGSNDGSVKNGAEVALNESDCSQIFSDQTFRTSHAGTWTTTAFSADATGTQGVAVFGTSDPDSTEYAIDAQTGTPIWNFPVQNPSPGGYDVGEAAVISAPGVNGFANGVVYVSGKYGIMNALDLKTGAVIWQFDMYPSGYTGLRDARSGPALVKNTIVFGYVGGVYALNATTGALLWHYPAPGVEVLSSPAVVGPPGQEIVAFSSVAGKLHVLKLSDGTELYNYQTGGYVTASVAVANGHLITVSSDGFLYDFTPGGGKLSAAPSTQVTYPADGAQIANPNGTLTVTGSASDALGVAAVEVAVAGFGQAGVIWYNAGKTTPSTAAFDNPAVLSAPGATSTTWSLTFPVPASGGTIEVFANAVNIKQQSDVTGAHSTFSLLPSATSPQITLSNQYVSPGGTSSVTGTGFQSGEVVDFSVYGNVLAKPVANGSGAVPSTKITLPGSAITGIKSKFGPTTLVAVGQTSQRTTSAFLDITNEWSQGAEGPTRTSFEGHDLKLHAVLSIAGNQWLKPAWYTPTPSPIESSPAVVKGIAYFGNDAGVLWAIRAATGAPAWTYTTPSGAAIHSSPAVDGSLVIFGSDDGNLYEVSTTTGLPIGSLAIPGGGKLGSPAAASGTAYVASDSGTVTAILESHSGSPTIIWQMPVGHSIHSSVAFDGQSPNKPVIVGDDSGAITALNGTTGATLWPAPAMTGAAVTASPSILGGLVFVGSTDGTVYAFDEQTGVRVWKLHVGSPIQAGGIVGGIMSSTPSVVYGTSSGSLIALSTAGAKQWEKNLGKPIVGIAGTYDVVISEASDGTIFGNRGTQSGNNIWSFRTSAALSTAPAIVDGTVYVGAQDTGLYAFTPFGKPPP